MDARSTRPRVALHGIRTAPLAKIAHLATRGLFIEVVLSEVKGTPVIVGREPPMESTRRGWGTSHRPEGPPQSYASAICGSRQPHTYASLPTAGMREALLCGEDANPKGRRPGRRRPDRRRAKAQPSPVYDISRDPNYRRDDHLYQDTWTKPRTALPVAAIIKEADAHSREPSGDRVARHHRSGRSYRTELDLR